LLFPADGNRDRPLTNFHFHAFVRRITVGISSCDICAIPGGRWRYDGIGRRLVASHNGSWRPSHTRTTTTT
jgi:hypothetical protein